MKNNAQAILLAGYPLEPIVALHVKKTYELQIEAALAATPQAHAVTIPSKQRLRA
jgi:hypothetical protein